MDKTEILILIYIKITGYLVIFGFASILLIVLLIAMSFSWFQNTKLGIESIIILILIFILDIFFFLLNLLGHILMDKKFVKTINKSNV